MDTMRARILTGISLENRGGVALESPTWRVAAEQGDRRRMHAVDAHAVIVCFRRLKCRDVATF